MVEPKSTANSANSREKIKKISIFSIIRGVPNRTYSFLAVAGLLTEPQAGTAGKPALSPRRDRPELPTNIEKILLQYHLNNPG